MMSTVASFEGETGGTETSALTKYPKILRITPQEFQI
jgi:hypothetical protein